MECLRDQSWDCAIHNIYIDDMDNEISSMLRSKFSTDAKTDLDKLAI